MVLRMAVWRRTAATRPPVPSCSGSGRAGGWESSRRKELQLSSQGGASSTTDVGLLVRKLLVLVVVRRVDGLEREGDTSMAMTWSESTSPRRSRVSPDDVIPMD